MSRKRLGEQLKEAFVRNGLDPELDLLYARIKVYERTDDPLDNKVSIISLYDKGDGSMNMDECEFYNELNKFTVEDGYGEDNVLGTVWCVNNTLFIRQEYDGWGHWTFINPVPPTDIDPNGVWLT